MFDFEKLLYIIIIDKNNNIIINKNKKDHKIA